ncbi:MAG: hypothetical protein JXB34_09635 [Bacteroidales bacterium]|nr:hypothetical protein [Bacteroidales bacterium]
MEIFWLVVFILSVAKGAYEFYANGFAASKYFFVISILSFLLYIARKSLRKKESKSAD